MKTEKKQYKLKRWYPDIPSYMDNGFIIDYYSEDEKAIYTYPNGCILGFSLPAHHLECRDYWERLYEEDGTNLEMPIDKVTIDNLDIALRMVGINLDRHLIDKIIDLVELIENKGDNTSIKDVVALQAEWKEEQEK